MEQCAQFISGTDCIYYNCGWSDNNFEGKLYFSMINARLQKSFKIKIMSADKCPKNKYFEEQSIECPCILVLRENSHDHGHFFNCFYVKTVMITDIFVIAFTWKQSWSSSNLCWYQQHWFLKSVIFMTPQFITVQQKCN